MIGETISHYRILDPLGSGGMGQVFRAEDTRLGRQVALKFLSVELARDPTSLERFQREARSASSLNHPGICTIYDIGEHSGRPYLVMEVLEGQTLRERIAGRPMAVDSLLDIRRANRGCARRRTLTGHHSSRHQTGQHFYFLARTSKDSRFWAGQASCRARRVGEAVGAGNSMTQPTTDNLFLTSPGSAIGTVAYMSPEQARGEDLDARTDLFSLGAVLYEMATGQAAFNGNTSAVVFDAILNRTPASPSSINPNVPPKLEDLIGKALEKERDYRYQTAAELRGDLKRLRRDSDSGRVSSGSTSSWTAAGPAAAGAPPNVPSSGTRPASSQLAPESPMATTAAIPLRRAFPWMKVVGAAIIIAAFVALVLHLRRPQPQQIAPSFSQMVISPLTSTGNIHSATISADGKWVAYVADVKGSHGIWIRQVATGSTAQVELGSPGEIEGLTFSPDSNYLFFVKRDEAAGVGTVFQVPSLGGAPRQIMVDVDSPDQFFARWQALRLREAGQ